MTALAQATDILPVGQLLEYLCIGKEAVFERHSRQLMYRLAKALDVTVSPIALSGRSQRFVFSRPNLNVRGFARDIHSLIFAGDDSEWAADSSFWLRVESPVDLPFIFACGNRQYQSAMEKVGSHFALIWHPSEIVSFLSSNDPIGFLKALLRQRFTLGSLHPFDHHHPIFDSGFLGRHEILQKFCDNPQTNYALVGPSKMGKTSLVKRYMRSRIGGNACQFYLDLYNVPVTDHALARALRMAIDPGATAYYEDPEHLTGFLQKVRSRSTEGRWDIILDEVDKHCGLHVMRVLTHLAQSGLYRVILVGRWRLMREALHTHDDNFSRLEPIVLESLSSEEGFALLERPFVDLGFNVHFVRRELISVVARLGRVPGYLHEFGCFLIDEVTKTSYQLTPDTIRRALSRVITSSRLIGLLNDLSSPAARVAALIMALHGNSGTEIDPLWLQEKFAKCGARVRINHCMEICDELVIHHLLAYSEGRYRICRWDFIAEGQIERKRFEVLLDEEIALLAATTG
jgi:hypothetical protein